MPEQLFRSDHIDIGHITTESSKVEAGLRFDPENELTSEELDWLRLQVEDRKPTVPGYYLNIMKLTKILLSKEHLAANGITEDFWKSFRATLQPSSSDRLERRYMSGIGTDMRIVNPSWLDQPLFGRGNFAQRYEQSFASYAETINTRIYPDLIVMVFLLRSVILFPRNPAIITLADFLENSVHTVLKTMADHDEEFWLEHLQIAALFRLAYPEKWRSDLLPLNIWTAGRQRLRNMRDPASDSNLVEICSVTASLTILAADDVHFTANGLEIVSNKIGNELAQSVLPEERKY